MKQEYNSQDARKKREQIRLQKAKLAEKHISRWTPQSLLAAFGLYSKVPLSKGTKCPYYIN